MLAFAAAAEADAETDGVVDVASLADAADVGAVVDPGGVDSAAGAGDMVSVMPDALRDGVGAVATTADAGGDMITGAGVAAGAGAGVVAAAGAA